MGRFTIYRDCNFAAVLWWSKDRKTAEWLANRPTGVPVLLSGGMNKNELAEADELVLKPALSPSGTS